MLKGRKPKPRAAKLREGDTGHRRLPPEIPVTAVKSTGCPDWFPPSAHEFYSRYAPELRLSAKAGELDEPALLLMAQAWALQADSYRAIQRDGLQGRRTGKHPCIQVWRDAVKTFMMIATHFGMTPADRERLVGSAQSVEHSDDLLNGNWKANEPIVDLSCRA